MTKESIIATMSQALEVFRSHDWYYEMAEGPAFWKARDDASKTNGEYHKLISELPTVEQELMRDLWRAKVNYTECETYIFANPEKKKACKADLDNIMSKVKSLISDGEYE